MLEAWGSSTLASSGKLWPPTPEDERQTSTGKEEGDPKAASVSFLLCAALSLALWIPAIGRIYLMVINRIMPSMAWGSWVTGSVTKQAVK